MQMPDVSEVRQRLHRLLDEHRRLFQVAFETDPLWRGLVYRARRRCGKPTCHCTRGELHATTVLADRSSSRQRNLCLFGVDLKRFRAMTEAYREVRRHRARAVKVQREILALFDLLEATRRQDALERFGPLLGPPT
jgi:hypothetical protein